MDIIFGVPSHGWIPISLRARDGTWSCDVDASDVLNDPIRECVELGLRLLDTPTEPLRAVFWQEPDSYVLEVVSRDGAATVMVGWSPGFVRAAEEPRKSLRIEFREDSTERMLAEELWHAVWRLRNVLLDRGAGGQAWAHEYPDRLIHQLAVRLAERGGLRAEGPPEPPTQHTGKG